MDDLELKPHERYQCFKRRKVGPEFNSLTHYCNLKPNHEGVCMCRCGYDWLEEQQVEEDHNKPRSAAL